ncbi:MAG TPA: alpha-L-arabinofuranosidase C-terminal domain-containing protein [Dehalococcoidales bacterium]|nr:alpha-L-arabinofuranosidase C-terminal domain-containing protein [Dehalococcoidales bacterium]
MNQIGIDLRRILSTIDSNIFGGFAEHLGRCIYGGIYQPQTPQADRQGFRKDVLQALKLLQLSNIRYPGGNFASGYRWMDGIGPLEKRPARLDLAWQTLEPNHFGTNEFIRFCRQLKAEPYLVVNCGDGTLREARDWVEYCNGSGNSDLVNLRRKHGFTAPHQVKYWGIGNEVDGYWQIGTKTPEEYARTFTEFGKVMKWVDPRIKLVASAVSDWNEPFADRIRHILEQGGHLVDYLALHWYAGNPQNDFAAYMAVSETIEKRLTACEGLIQGYAMQRKLEKLPAIAVDEWNVWYRTHPQYGGNPEKDHLEEKYNLEDALVTAIHLNAFIRHAKNVKMANLAQIVNVIAPVFTRPDSLFLQTIFFPFEIFSSTCGTQALDIWWEGDTFSAGGFKGIRTLDVSGTLNPAARKLVLYVVNRSSQKEMETRIKLDEGLFRGPAQVYTVNGPDIKSGNSFEKPDLVVSKETRLNLDGTSFTYSFEPHSFTALVCTLN